MYGVDLHQAKVWRQKLNPEETADFSILECALFDPGLGRDRHHAGRERQRAAHLQRPPQDQSLRLAQNPQDLLQEKQLLHQDPPWRGKHKPLSGNFMHLFTSLHFCTCTYLNQPLTKFRSAETPFPLRKKPLVIRRSDESVPPNYETLEGELFISLADEFQDDMSRFILLILLSCSAEI